MKCPHCSLVGGGHATDCPYMRDMRSPRAEKVSTDTGMIRSVEYWPGQFARWDTGKGILIDFPFGVWPRHPDFMCSGFPYFNGCRFVHGHEGGCQPLEASTALPHKTTYDCGHVLDCKCNGTINHSVPLPFPCSADCKGKVTITSAPSNAIPVEKLVNDLVAAIKDLATAVRESRPSLCLHCGQSHVCLRCGQRRCRCTHLDFVAARTI